MNNLNNLNEMLLIESPSNITELQEVIEILSYIHDRTRYPSWDENRKMARTEFLAHLSGIKSTFSKLPTMWAMDESLALLIAWVKAIDNKPYKPEYHLTVSELALTFKKIIAFNKVEKKTSDIVNRFIDNCLVLSKNVRNAKIANYQKQMITSNLANYIDKAYGILDEQNW